MEPLIPYSAIKNHSTEEVAETIQGSEALETDVAQLPLVAHR